MAILAKIRQRTLVLILIIGLALFAFVISDVFNNGGGGEKLTTEIGTVNGESISYQQFQEQVEYGVNISRGSRSTIDVVNTLWDEEIKNMLIEQQLDELGITIEEDEIWNKLITSPDIINAPDFQDETGTFVEGKLREYINNLEATKDLPQSREAYQRWLNKEQYTIREAKKELYYNLIKAGAIVTVKEGEMAYRMENDKVTFKYVRVPYTSVEDSEIEIRKSDIQNYINSHKSEFKEEASRDIQYVYFPETPSKADEDLTKTSIEEAKAGLIAATTENVAGYVNENTESNEPESFMYKSQLPQAFAEEIIALEEGDVYGPYKVGSKYKVSRITGVSQLPDSVKSRHILIRFAGSTGASPDVKKTKDEAKKQADSILAVVKRNKSKFADLAKNLSDDSSAEQGGDLGWFNSITGARLTPKFKEFVYEKPAGTIDVIETPFGFHVIEIEEQKNKQKVVKLATINKEVEITDETINELFTKSSKFESDATKADSFVALAKENGYEAKPVNKIKELESRIAGIQNQRPVVRWAFEEDTEVGDIRRFPVGSGFIVVQITAKRPAGLSSVEEASARVLPTLKNLKKAELIKSKYASSKTLADLASASGNTEQQATSLSMQSPIVPGAGEEKKVVGAAFALNKDDVSKLIAGKSGVFIIQLVDKVAAPAKETYLAESNQLRNQRAAKAVNTVVEALKNTSEIEDNRSIFY
jgi:parvulin-like peptidyl-prolyl isomerase